MDTPTFDAYTQARKDASNPFENARQTVELPVVSVSVAPASRAFVLVVAPTGGAGDADSTRLGIAVGRRVGNAVVRNRVKRCIREWFRHQRASLRRGVDLVVVGRTSAAALSSAETQRDLDSLARRARLVGDAG